MSNISIETVLENHETVIDPDIIVKVVDEELWETFFNVTNEMVSIATGTELRPELKVNIEGLKSSLYAILLEFRPVSKNRWRFANGRWTQENSGDSLKYAGYLHKSHFMNADSWMRKPITFKDLKIATNENAAATLSAAQQQNTVILNLLHKYVPIIKVFQLGGMFTLVCKQELYTCAFIVVNGYKNDLMIQLKGNKDVAKPREAPVVILTQPYADFPKNFLNHPDTPYSQTRPVGLMINNLQDYQPKPLKEEQLRNLTPFTSIRLFPPHKLSFANFLHLYTIKTMFNKNDYTLNKYVEDIRNKNFNLPNAALLYRKTKISDTKVVFTTRDDIEFVVNTQKPANPYATPSPYMQFKYPLILSEGISLFQQSQQINQSYSVQDYKKNERSNVSGITADHAKNFQSASQEVHSSFSNLSSQQSSSEVQGDVADDLDSLESSISLMAKDISKNIPELVSKVNGDIDNMIQSYLQIKGEETLEDLTFFNLADPYDPNAPDVPQNLDF